MCFQIIIIDMDGCKVTVQEIRPFNDPFFVKHLYESRQKKKKKKAHFLIIKLSARVL